MTNKEIAKEIQVHIQALKELKQVMKENNTIKTLQTKENDLRDLSHYFDILSIQADEKNDYDNAIEFQDKSDEYYTQAKRCDETLDTLSNIFTNLIELDNIDIEVFD